MHPPAALALIILCGVAASGCSQATQAESVPSPPDREQRFDELLAKNAELTFEQLSMQTPQRSYKEQLSFDPREAKFYEETVKTLQLSDSEQEMLRKQGLVSVDHGQRYSFGSMYFAIYSGDLPVLVTTDSILHAMHRSYDDLLMEMEQTFLTAALEEILAKCHEQLGDASPRWGDLARNHEDVDLYLTVARNLLQGAGAPEGPRNSPHVDLWDGTLFVYSKLEQDEAALELLKLVQSLQMQSPGQGEGAEIYGCKRAIDFSQFKPRGHYTHSPMLSRYFRAMMWLGRADTGWNVLPPDPQSGIVSDSSRELRNGVLLTQLLASSGADARLEQMNEVIDFMVGPSDNLTPQQTADLLEQRKIAELSDLASSSSIESFQKALQHRHFGTQKIQSQTLTSNPDDPRQVETPSLYQMFGQRFVIDSFVMSKVAFDEIKFDGRKVERMMPTGLDVAFALGNDAALPLLEEELELWHYAPNLATCRASVAQQSAEFWWGNLYNVWLDALRTLDDEAPAKGAFPEAMRSEAWQRKQLQTQLASWSELRHNTVLYAKQSYTSGVMCEYPSGYVEPYPDLFARVKFFAEEGSRLIENADYNVSGKYANRLSAIKTKQVEFLKKMSTILARLESLARKELAAEPFSEEDAAWLKKVIDARGGGSGGPRYDGWYCDLFYRGGKRAAEWDPTVVDVHTDPNSREVLEEGVGDCNFLVVAVDHEDDRMIYVGPAYSYYEFRQPVENRLTDVEWQEMLAAGKQPSRPEWTKAFQAPVLDRHLGK